MYVCTELLTEPPLSVKLDASLPDLYSQTAFPFPPAAVSADNEFVSSTKAIQPTRGKL